MPDNKIKYTDMRDLLVLAKKTGMTLLPVFEFETEELVTLDDSTLSFKDFLELAKSKGGEGILYYYSNVIEDESYISIRLESLLDAADDLEFPTIKSKKDFRRELTTVVKGYNDNVKDVYEDDYETGYFIVKINCVWHMYEVELRLDDSLLPDTDSMLDLINDSFFDGELFDDGYDSCCDCDGNCDCLDDCDCDDECHCCNCEYDG